MLKLIDTNVMLRVLVPSSPDQTEAAKLMIASNDCLVSNIVVAEIVWVLTKFYKYNRSQMSALLEIFTLKTVFLEEPAITFKAIERFIDSRFSFIDCFLLAKANEAGLAILTFDKKLQKAS